LLFYVSMLNSLFLQADFTFFRVSPIRFWFGLHRLPLMFLLSSPIIIDQVLVLVFMIYLYIFLFSIIFDHYFVLLLLQDYFKFLVITYFVGFEDWYTRCLKMIVMSLVWSWNSLSSVKVHLVEVGTVVILFNFDMHWYYFHLNLFRSSFIVSGCWFLGCWCYCIVLDVTILYIISF